jgi:hypothetical protein
VHVLFCHVSHSCRVQGFCCIHSHVRTSSTLVSDIQAEARLNWDSFAQAVVQEFETDTHRAKTMELLNLKQVGSVEDYHRRFEQLIYHIRLFDGSLSDTMLTAQFLLDLRDDIRYHVEIMLPVTVAKAATSAAIQEQLKEYRRANKLCYKCGEKYVPNHKCTIPPGGIPFAQLTAIVSDIGDGGGIL